MCDTRDKKEETNKNNFYSFRNFNYFLFEVVRILLIICNLFGFLAGFHSVSFASSLQQATCSKVLVKFFLTFYRDLIWFLFFSEIMMQGFLFCHILGGGNSCINPYLHGFLNKNILTELKNISLLLIFKRGKRRMETVCFTHFIDPNDKWRFFLFRKIPHV